MDPNLLRHLDPSSSPNKAGRAFQGANTLSRIGSGFDSVHSVNPGAGVANLNLTPADSQTPLWDAPGLSPDDVVTESPMTAQSRLSLYSYGQQTSTAPTDLSYLATAPQPSPYSLSQTPTLPMRAPRKREAHERKRSRLNADIAPFDSVDYWIQFDNEGNNLETASADSLGDQNPPQEKASLAQRTSSISEVAGSIAASIPTRRRKPEEVVDDSALDNALSDEEDGLSSIAELLSKFESMPPSAPMSIPPPEVPPREGLYSTPLSWEKPQLGLRPYSFLAQPRPLLTDDEQQRLVAIAMGHGTSMGRFVSNPNLNFGGFGLGGIGFGGGLGQMTDIAPQPKPSKSPPNPRKPSESGAKDSAAEKPAEKSRSGERTAHNDIERKYRTKLKDKIAELRDAVPSLSTIPEDSSDDDGSSHPSRAPKVSKGTVLTKATEYIHYLEKKNKAMTQQHQELSRRIQAFEVLLSASARPIMQMPSHSRTLFDPRAFC